MTHKYCFKKPWNLKYFQAFLDEEKNRVPPLTPVAAPRAGALHGFATEETSTETAVTVKPINDNGIYLLSNFRKRYCPNYINYNVALTFIFLPPDPKGHVSYCHHFSSGIVFYHCWCLYCMHLNLLLWVKFDRHVHVMFLRNRDAKSNNAFW